MLVSPPPPSTIPLSPSRIRAFKIHLLETAIVPSRTRLRSVSLSSPAQPRSDPTFSNSVASQDVPTATRRPTTTR